ncbi:MAG: NotI family restriction endonuclease [bacterium]|nr:NotI family restriction endonuclease [bacterium]
MTAVRYGIAEWYGHELTALPASERQRLAESAQRRERRPCPFTTGDCTKPGGVCSIRPYIARGDRIAASVGPNVVTCPNRFEQQQMLLGWLAEIVGFGSNAMTAREVPFMVGPAGAAAGMIDLVVAAEDHGLRWYGLEIQSVYFSGDGMGREFAALGVDGGGDAPFPVGHRRPDWRSSSAKRLMPQLQVKGPTLRRWGSKIAVAVDLPFHDSIGGPSPSPSNDLDSGDVIWLVSEARDGQLLRRHWEVLTLEQTCDKLLAAAPVTRAEFEDTLRSKLTPLPIGEPHD